MVKHGIRIYARIRPTKKSVGSWEINELEDGSSSIGFNVPKSESAGLVNNKKELYSFKFHKVFNDKVRQEDVFQGVAYPVIENCLEGYNGTVFAYGQTGSGKTFTITGGAEKYSDRGIIPRTLSAVFRNFQENPEKIFTVHISYLEIYNEHGYDLLDSRQEASKLEDLPKVSLMETGGGGVHLKNLSLQPATNEEEALNWLFLGDTNRMIAETPMNMASTRSHCIFTIYITIREPGSDVIRRSKLHLVDLAGSERIGKSGVAGTQLTEAKYINLSLHFLEQVIVALSEKSRSHIPYRNSMMTSVLKDSLGGNCMTSMVATCSVETRNVDESITTCRFAQRVALVKNDATLNEEVDPKMMVARLKQQVVELKEELSLATGKERTDALSQEDLDWCRERVEVYIQNKESDAKLSVGSDMRMITCCFKVLKAKILDLLQSPAVGLTQTQSSRHPGQRPALSEGGGTLEQGEASEKEWERTKGLLKQRDDEINILVKMLKQEKKRAAQAEATMLALKEGGGLGLSGGRDAGAVGSDAPSRRVESTGAGRSEDSLRLSSAEDTGATIASQKRAALKAELSKARQEAFEIFRRDCLDSDVLEQQKRELKTKYAEAKSLGERVNFSRQAINRLKAQIEKIRVSRTVLGDTSEEAQRREEDLRCQMEEEKMRFKQVYQTLKGMKTEIEHSQHLLEKAKVKLQKDFEVWWEEEARKMRPGSSSSRSRPVSRTSTKSKRHTDVAPSVDQQPPAPLDPPRGHSNPSHTEHSPVQKSFSERMTSHVHNDAAIMGHLGSSPYQSTGGMPVLSGYQPGAKGGRLGNFPQVSGSHPNELGKTVGVSRDSSDRSTYGSHQTGPPSARTIASGALYSGSNNSYTNSDVLRTQQDGGTVQGGSASHTASHGSIPLTGDRKADADIMAFYKARQKLIERGLKRTS